LRKVPESCKYKAAMWGRTKWGNGKKTTFCSQVDSYKS